ncbi:MAG: nuclear transport factor 2 family protein [Acidobacteria bacterium]|nr:nuclear transport factor 2 family protein [Acidobacteriota bacterium]MBK9529842.1 nuclear transport factor 2 family protein [Acidobacteriota bacterium]MBP7475559.1 nuclear transport factor 2 family protein [Pyrinomonadaceae bacterium]MBP9109943.1 nuclear transport factor 2 family protein [Pyrinomonadaceae bacterium]
METREIAERFSSGQFDSVYDHLADDVEWDVIADFKVRGRSAVIEKCGQIASYFASVTTNFRTLNTIVDGSRVAINGTAKLIKDGEVVSSVSSCDVYEFNNDGRLARITSYCITDKRGE